MFAVLVLLVAGIGAFEVMALRARLEKVEAELERLRANKPVIEAERPWADLEPSPSEPEPAREDRTAASAPDAVRSGYAALYAFFTGGNLLVRIGVVLLFFGVAFLLRYVAEHSRLPIELRLAGVASGGIALLILGWRLRHRRAGYALTVQGGGVGVLYLTVFAALRLYDVLSPATAFPLLAVIAMLSAALAIAQNSQAFAVLGVTGGFLAPILASTGHGSHVVLFSYYAVLDVGIIAVAWSKAWRPLNLVGFLFTFVIASIWGVLQYRAEDFATTEPFLVLFFALYVGIAMRFTLRQPQKWAGYVDGTLVFGTPIATFGLQSAMLHEREHAMAWSALAMGVVYLGLAALWFLRRKDSQRLLADSFLALGVAFVTLAVPLGLSPRLNAATWALEGAASIWLGCRQGRALPRGAGVALIAAAGCVLAGEFTTFAGRLSFPLDALWGVMTLTGAAIYGAGTLQAQRARLHPVERNYSGPLFLWGMGWWLAAGFTEIDTWVPASLDTGTALAFASLTALAASEIHRRLEIAAARALSLLLLPTMVLIAFAAGSSFHAPVDHGGWFAWPVAFAVFYVIAYRHEGAPGVLLADVLHLTAAWLLVALLSWQMAVTVSDLGLRAELWTAVAWVIVPASVLFLLPLATVRIAWPFVRRRRAYLVFAGAGFATCLAFWSVVTNVVENGAMAPLPYLPLFNPLDITQALVLFVLVRYRRVLSSAPSRWPTALLAALGFIWVNAVLLRTLNQWAGIPFDWVALGESTLVQTSLSICWTVIAVVTMRVAVIRSSRPAWLAAATLLGGVIAKLFLVDLSHSGTIERIVSFVGVALLIMAAGYFSPLPPDAGKRP